MGFNYKIFDPANAGAVNAIPDLKLSTAAAIDNSNVLIEEGEVVTAPLRLSEGTDSNEYQIKVPEYAYTITLINALANSITIDGDDNTIEAGDEVYIMYSYEEEINPSGEFLNPSVITATNFNDGYYTVETVSRADGETEITVSENILYNSTVGELFHGTTEALKIHNLYMPDGSEEIFIFTKNAVYQYKPLGPYITKLEFPYELSTITYWSIVQGTINFGSIESSSTAEGLIACPNTGRPVKISSAGIITVLDAETDDSSNYISNAKHCIFYENYLILGNVTLSTGNDYPKRFYRSAQYDTQDFANSDLGAGWNEVEGPDYITGFGREQDNLIVFKNESIHQVYLIGEGETVFQINRISTPVGCIAPDSAINDRENNLYFFGTDKRFKALRGGDISDIIEKTVDQIKDTLIPYISGIYMQSEDRMLWAVPSSASSTNNDKVIVIKKGNWTFLDLELSAFSIYRETATDTWGTIDGTWATIARDWGELSGTIGNKNIICCDYDGNLGLMFQSYADLGSSYESSVTISTDLSGKGALDVYKRITKIQFYMRPMSSGEDNVTITISKDNDIGYVSATSFDTYDANKDIVILTKPMSIRAKSFRIKVSTEERFKLIGMIIYYETFGRR